VLAFFFFSQHWNPKRSHPHPSAGHRNDDSPTTMKGESMHLYKIERHDRDPIHIVARSSREAADLFVTWSAAVDRAPAEFTLACQRLDTLNPQQQVQVRCAIAAGLVGVCHFDEEIGWTFSPPMWQPLGPGEQTDIAVEGGER
jgi:hypothetical protein